MAKLIKVHTFSDMTSGETTEHIINVNNIEDVIKAEIMSDKGLFASAIIKVRCTEANNANYDFYVKDIYTLEDVDEIIALANS